MIVLAYNTSWYVYNFRMPLIRALKARGYEVTVLAPRDGYTDRIIAEGIGYQDIPLEGKGRNPLRELATLWAFRKAYKTLRPEIVLQYTIKPNLYGSLAARSLGIPVINNVTGLGEAFTNGGFFESFARSLYRVSFRKAARVFFQNPDDFELFLEAKLVTRNQADLLPGSGVDTTRFSPLPKAEGPFTFLQVGRLIKAKGAEDLIKAASIVKAERPEVRFAFLGRYDPTDPKSVDPKRFEEARDSGLVEHWGETDDVRPLIAQADCVVLPSYYREGTPRSLLEAGAMAKPLIAANSVGTKEPVKDGINGYLHEPRNPNDLAEKMLLLLRGGNAASMGEKSRAYMIERFEENVVIDKYLGAVLQFGKKKQGGT